MPAKPNNCTFYIVRHGETEANVTDLLQGHWDTPLTAKGREQARITAQRLKDVHFDAAFSSDLSRTVQSIEIIALDKKIKIVTAKALREKHYGPYEKKPRYETRAQLKELFDQYDQLETDAERMNFRIYEGGETDNEAVTRFLTHLRELALAYPGKTLLIGSHGGLMRYFLVKLGFATYAQLQHKAVNNSAYLIVQCDGSEFFLKETWGVDIGD